MKFENLELNMMIQHKESGKVFKVIEFGALGCPYLDGEFIDSYSDSSRMIDYADAKLFRKYKESENET